MPTFPSCMFAVADKKYQPNRGVPRNSNPAHIVITVQCKHQIQMGARSTLSKMLRPMWGTFKDSWASCCMFRCHWSIHFCSSLVLQLETYERGPS